LKLSLHTALNTVDPAAYNGWPGWLNGPCADAASLAAELALAGFETESLINDRATFEAYDAAIDRLAGRAVPGDVVFLHHSHHGGRIDNGVFGGFNETFCLYDGELPDVKWIEMLGRFKHGVHVIALLDCCHSGGMDRAQRSASRARPSHVRGPLLTWPSLVRAPLEASFIGLPACQAEETCVEVPVPELAEVRGAWTYAWVLGLQEARRLRGPAFLNDIQAGAVRYCAEHHPAQHPRVVRGGLNAEAAWQTRLA
jgi:hypothetical protein